MQKPGELVRVNSKDTLAHYIWHIVYRLNVHDFCFVYIEVDTNYLFIIYLDKFPVV